MLGTLFALLVSLIIIGLFVQNRRGFILPLSAFAGLCTYPIGVSKRWYFWFMAGFVTIVVSFDGGTNPPHAFDTAVLHAQETGLWILVYTLVSNLLWPSRSKAGFEPATLNLSQTQHLLCSNYLGLAPAATRPIVFP